jgi:hypothetical protein
MKRLALAALVLAWFVIPVCAQHNSAHGESSGHAVAAFHGSPGASVSRGFSSRAGYAQISPGNNIPRTPQGNWIGRSGPRPPYAGSLRPGSPNRGGSSPFRRPYYSHYRPIYYGYGVPIWAPPYFLSSPGDAGYDDSDTAENTGSPGYDSPGYDDQADNQEPPPWPGVPYAAPPARPSSARASDNEETVTLIFRDGRPPEEIHNYILTRGTIYVGDQYHRQIPIDQLDLGATVQVNRDLGVDFRLPNGSR